MNRTELIGQLIELRGKGWTYEKIARHTGIDRKILLAWGMRYKDCIDAEREINRATLEEIRRLRASAAAEPPRQESHFYNLPGEGRPESSIVNRKSQIRTLTRKRRARPQRLRVSVVKRVRGLLKSPLVRTAIRYAIFRR